MQTYKLKEFSKCKYSSQHIILSRLKYFGKSPGQLISFLFFVVVVVVVFASLVFLPLPCEFCRMMVPSQFSPLSRTAPRGVLSADSMCSSLPSSMRSEEGRGQRAVLAYKVWCSPPSAGLSMWPTAPFCRDYITWSQPSKNSHSGTSLVAQWLRIRLPMQGTQVRSLVGEDHTCCGATKPVRHNYWACVPQVLKPAHLEPVLHNKRSHRNEKPEHRNEE